MPSRWVHEHRFPDRQALAAALAGEIKVDLEEAIAARGAASLVVSGGRTPARLFARLRAEKLDWTRIWVTLADERWVETTAEASNERFVRETLLVGPAAAAHFVGLKNPAPTPEAGADWASSRVDSRAASVRRGRCSAWATTDTPLRCSRARWRWRAGSIRPRRRRASPSTR